MPMKFSFLLPLAFLTIFASCNKGKFTTRPQITIKSYSKKSIGNGQNLTINLQFTDKEGDIGNGEFVYIPKRLNKRPLLPTIPDYDSVRLVVPTFPDETQGEYILSLPWINLHKSDQENDTIFMRFVVVDRAFNKSDTVNSDQLVILKF
jgi:hypothetical protein